MHKDYLLKLKNIFKVLFSSEDINLETLRKINNPKWDSLATVTLIAAIESEFGIILDEASYENFTSYLAVENILEEHNL